MFSFHFGKYLGLELLVYGTEMFSYMSNCHAVSQGELNQLALLLVLFASLSHPHHLVMSAFHILADA